MLILSSFKNKNKKYPSPATQPLQGRDASSRGSTLLDSKESALVLWRVLLRPFPSVSSRGSGMPLTWFFLPGLHHLRLAVSGWPTQVTLSLITVTSIIISKSSKKIKFCAYCLHYKSLLYFVERQLPLHFFQIIKL